MPSERVQVFSDMEIALHVYRESISSYGENA